MFARKRWDVRQDEREREREICHDSIGCTINERSLKTVRIY